MAEDVAQIVGEEDGDGRVALDYAQEEIDVGVGVGDYVLCGVGSDLHALALLRGQVGHQVVAHIQKEAYKSH